MTLKLTPPYSPIAATGDVLTPVDIRPFLCAPLMQWVAVDPNVAVMSAGSGLAGLLNLTGFGPAHTAKLDTTIALDRAIQMARTEGSEKAAVPEAQKSADVAALTQSLIWGALMLRRYPYSHAARSASPDNVLLRAGAPKTQLYRLTSALVPFMTVTGDQELAYTKRIVDDNALPIQGATLDKDAFDPLAANELDVFMLQLQRPDIFMNRAPAQPGTSLFDILQAALLIAAVDLFPKWLKASDTITQPAELGIDAQTFKDHSRREVMQKVVVSFMLEGLGLAPYLFLARILKKTFEIPFIRKELEISSTPLELTEWDKMLNDLGALKIPPMYAQMARIFNSGRADTPWGSSTLYPLDPGLGMFDEIGATLGAAEPEAAIAANRKRGTELKPTFPLSVDTLTEYIRLTAFRAGAIPPQISRLRVRDSIVTSGKLTPTTDVSSKEWRNSTAVARLRAIVRAAYQFLRDTGGSDIASNVSLRYYKTMADIAGWSSWDEKPVFTGKCLTEDPVVYDGVLTSAPVSDSYDLMTRRIVPYNDSYGDQAIFPVVYDKTFVREQERIAALVSNGAFSKELGLMLSLAHSLPVIWLTNGELKEDTTLVSGVNPRAYIHEDDLRTENIGPDAERIANDGETWAAIAGTTEAKLNLIIEANPRAWAHLRAGDAFRPGFVMTSATLRAMGLNVRLRLPFLGFRSVVLLTDDRIVDAYYHGEDRIVRLQGRTPLRAALTAPCEADIRALGVASDAWKRRV